MKEKNLYLIDAMALIYRSYYALNKNPRINSKGLNTSAILGFANTLLDLIKKHKPTHIGVAFDLYGPTVRHEQFEDYKANRQESPEDIIAAVPYVKELVKAMNIPMLCKEGYEADDVIGTLSKKAARGGFKVFMVTPDKDYAQLVEENILMLKLPRMGNGEEILGVKEVIEKFEVREPKQVIDILGLWGDSSDNIPGVPSIGEKKAKLLMKQFDSIEEIIENTDKIESASIRKAIEENKDKAILSKQLATIILDVPIDFDEDSLLFTQPNFEHCKKLFSELEFKTFEKRFFNEYAQMEGYADFVEKNFKEEKSQVNQIKKNTNQQFDLFGNITDSNDLFSQTSFATLDTIEHNYLLIQDSESLEKEIIKIKVKGFCSFDCETTGLEIDSNLIGISFSHEKNSGFFVLIPQKEEENKPLLNLLKNLLEDENIEKIAHNIKFDKNVLLNYGIEVKGKCFDTILAHYLIDSEARHKLDNLANSYLNYEMIPFEKVFGKVKDGKININLLDKTALKEYAVEDADIALQLKSIFEEKLKEANLLELFENIEMPLVDVLLSMEREGVRINTEELALFSERLNKEKLELESKIYALANEEFNISSPKQLGDILFKKLQIIEKAKTTSATKQFSTSEDVLLKLVNKHPIIPLILDYRSITKLKNTYVDAFPLLVNKKTNHIHTNYNQFTTATGRLSSTNPNLQNIPIRTELGREMRKAFVPRNDDYILLSADYSQIELRIIASLSKDENSCQAFKDGIDIHTATASKIFHIPLNEVTKDQRRYAKSVNFGIVYGISAFGLSEQLSIPRKEAQELIDQYFAQYPKIKTFIEESIKIAQEKGYAQTLMKRRRYLYDINSRNANLRNFAGRNAVNMPIQGSSADMIKKAMIEIYAEFNKLNLKSKLILQVHDELVLDVYIPELEKVKEIVEKKMKEALPLENVPIEVESNTGKNWLEAH
ncbi:MAG: DNA polymerase I [Bacteroidales bacterium]|nr:DNA polymerase I [Bacteroidales bacterium]